MISTHTPGTQCPGPRPFQRGPGARLSVFFCRNYHLSSNKSPLNTAALSPLLKPRRGNQKDSHCLPSFQGSGLIFELTMPSPGHQGSVQSGKVELVFPGSVLVCSSCRPPWRTCWLGRVWSTGDWSHWKGNCGRNEATLRCSERGHPQMLWSQVGGRGPKGADDELPSPSGAQGGTLGAFVASFCLPQAASGTEASRSAG